MKPRNLYLLEVALAVTAAVALALWANQLGGFRNGLWALWPGAR